PPTQRMAPVDLSAATSTNRTATVSTPGFQNPASASFGVSTPLAIRSSAAPASTLSGVKRSHKSMPSVATTTTIVSHPCQPRSIMRSTSSVHVVETDNVVLAQVTSGLDL